MKAERSGMSPVLRWVIGILMVPVLYVLTFPPIVYTTQKYFSHSELALKFMDVYIPPYNYLLAQTPLFRPMLAYDLFWREQFGLPLPAL
jgi:hypothetical protein